MTVVLFLNVMRFSCYVMMKSMIWIIPIACIDGTIYAATNILITTCSKKISQPGTETTVQAIFMSIFNGVGTFYHHESDALLRQTEKFTVSFTGTSVGGLGGGIMYTWLGGVTMFKIFGLSSFVACILHLFLRCTISKRLAKPTAHISYELREKE